MLSISPVWMPGLLAMLLTASDCLEGCRRVQRECLCIRRIAKLKPEVRYKANHRFDRLDTLTSPLINRRVSYSLGKVAAIFHQVSFDGNTRFDQIDPYR